MFKDNPLVGVIMAMVFITVINGSVIYFTRNMSAHEKMLVVFIMLITMMSSVWLVDNVIAFEKQLLTEKEDDAILKAMTTIIQVMLGYYSAKATMVKQDN